MNMYNATFTGKLMSALLGIKNFYSEQASYIAMYIYAYMHDSMCFTVVDLTERMG